MHLKVGIIGGKSGLPVSLSYDQHFFPRDIAVLVCVFWEIGEMLLFDAMKN